MLTGISRELVIQSVHWRFSKIPSGFGVRLPHLCTLLAGCCIIVTLVGRVADDTNIVDALERCVDKLKRFDASESLVNLEEGHVCSLILAIKQPAGSGDDAFNMAELYV